MNFDRYLVKNVWSAEDDAYVATVPALRGCIAHGVTFEEAGREIEIAMKLWLNSAKKHGDPIPEPDIIRED